MYNIYFDIETIPRVWTEVHQGFLREKLEEKYKTEATIEKHLAEGEADQALKPFGARVVAICAWSEDTGAHYMAGANEGRLLESFQVFLSQQNECRLVGFNNARFDTPALTGAYMANEYEVPPILKRANDHPYQYQADLYRLFPNTGGLQMAALNLGLQPLVGTTGADVWPLFKQDRLDLIEEHCIDDVRLVMEIGQRYGL